MKKNKMMNIKNEFLKKSYNKPVLNKIGDVSKMTAGTGGTVFDNGNDARAGKHVS